MSVMWTVLGKVFADAAFAEEIFSASVAKPKKPTGQEMDGIQQILAAHSIWATRHDVWQVIGALKRKQPRIQIAVNGIRSFLLNASPAMYPVLGLCAPDHLFLLACHGYTGHQGALAGFLNNRQPATVMDPRTGQAVTFSAPSFGLTQAELAGVQHAFGQSKSTHPRTLSQGLTDFHDLAWVQPTFKKLFKLLKACDAGYVIVR